MGVNKDDRRFIATRTCEDVATSPPELTGANSKPCCSHGNPKILVTGIFLLYSWGSLFGVPITIPLTVWP